MSKPSLENGGSRSFVVGSRLGHSGSHTTAPATLTDDAPAPLGRTDRPRQTRHRSLLVKLGLFAAVAAVAVVLLQAFVVQPFTVSGDAMAPTVRAGDRILVLKWGLLEGSIGRGEIVVFHPPQTLPCTVVGGHGGDLVLRVVGLPGEAIRSVGDTILVNGHQLRHRSWYDPRFGAVGSTPVRPTTLGANQYFLMADNRSDACDSRLFGPIAKSAVVGEGIAVVARNGHFSLGTL